MYVCSATSWIGSLWDGNIADPSLREPAKGSALHTAARKCTTNKYASGKARGVLHTWSRSGCCGAVEEAVQQLGFKVLRLLAQHLLRHAQR